jgi:hypothetical protein
MESEKVAQILKYALAVAARADEARSQELGAIHLIKYVYLADLAYAERNAGRTFTGVNWQFFHYGPWSPAVHDQVRNVVDSIAVVERIFSHPKYDKDGVRWRLEEGDAEELFAQMDRALPTIITSKVRWAVHTFGNDTTALLHHVYGTRPMLRAAPKEPLSFEGLSISSTAIPNVDTSTPLSAKAQKKQKARYDEAQARIRAKLEERRAQRAQRNPTTQPPRYDDVFVEGQKWLDTLAGEPLEELEGELEFSDAVWKDPWRTEPDVA